MGWECTEVVELSWRYAVRRIEIHDCLFCNKSRICRGMGVKTIDISVTYATGKTLGLDKVVLGIVVGGNYYIGRSVKHGRVIERHRFSLTIYYQ